jgi:hypothetical protein
MTDTARRRPSSILLRGLLRGSLAAALVVGLLVAGLPAAQAFPTKLSANGQQDFNYGSSAQSSGGPATTTKPESKLFYTGDGVSEPVRWWAVLGTSGQNAPSAGVWLFELVNHAWVARMQLPGADPWAKGDTVFDGTTLYVSTRDQTASAPGNPRQSSLYKIPYLGNGTFGTANIGPFPITTANIETLTIAVDTVERVWTTFEQGQQIKVAFTAAAGTSFSQPTTISQTNVNSDDISAITAFDGKIGVFWSDQVARKDFFAWRSDDAAVNPLPPWNVETAFGGGVGGCPTASSGLCADDHMNLKVSGNEVYVAIKTSLGDGAGTSPSDPLITLLRRSANGSWASFPVSPVSQHATRPIMVLSPLQDRIWVWAQRAREIDVWESSFTSPGFNSNGFVPWIANGGTSNDATSTRQLTTSQTGTVVEASVNASTQYWHNEFLPGGGGPVAPSISSFSPLSGPVGTSVTIDGSGFTGATDVRFNGTSVAGNFTVNSDTQVTATVPNSASSGPIAIDAPGGTATSASSFTVTPTTPGTISEVQSKKASANGQSISATLPLPPTAGNVLVAVVVVPQAATASFATPTGWTAPFVPARGAIFWKASNGSEQSVTVNLSAGQTDKVLRMSVVELSGVDTVNPFDQAGSAIIRTTTSSVTAATAGPTSQADEWAIAAVAHNGTNGGAPAATNGFTVLDSDSRSISATKLLSAAGTVSTTISWTTPRTGSWIIATFRAT